MKELRLICNSLKGANRVFGVFPFVRDGKSDHVKRFGETVGYKDTAMEISSSGLESIAIFDQHSSQHPNFYDTTHYRLRTVHHIYLMKILIEYAIKNNKLFFISSHLKFVVENDIRFLSYGDCCLFMGAMRG